MNYITGLASAGWRWGADIINGIVNGIRSCIGAVANAVTECGKYDSSHLDFSVPDEGPLTDFESWMPDFMSGLAEGIEKEPGNGEGGCEQCGCGYGNFAADGCG